MYVSMYVMTMCMWLSCGLQCVSFLVASGASLHANIPDGDVCGGKDTFPPSLLHLAILSPHTRGRDMLSLLLPTLICELELRDSQGEELSLLSLPFPPPSLPPSLPPLSIIQPLLSLTRLRRRGWG